MKISTELSEKWIGQSLPRVEDSALLTGNGRYIDDLSPVPNIHFAAILRSPYGHARIQNIDVSAAIAIPGVLGVVTGKDVASLSQSIANLFGLPADYYPCAVDKVRYFGEPVAVAVAKDRYIAEDALDAIHVTYEQLPAVVDPETAAKIDAPKLHERLESNVVHHRRFVYGDPQAAFSKADRIVSVKTHYPRVTSMPIEGYGVIAHFERMPDRYTVWSNFQGPYVLHPIMCAALGVSGDRLRLISPPFSGGSFGIKQAIYPYIVLIALAARVLGAPVKWTEDRLEHIAGSSSASDRVVKMDGAFSSDGRLLALRVKQLENVGAYLRPPEPSALYRFHATPGGPYRLNDVEIENFAVVSNQLPTGLNRGFGGAQYCYPLERLMHRAAVELQVDPAELRRKNFIRAEEFPYECSAGGILDAARQNGRKVGVGIACSIESAASNLAYVTLALTAKEREKSLPKSGASAAATIRIDPLGAIVVHVDGAPNGQGHATVISQAVADQIGVDPARVRVITELDTLNGDWSVSSGNYGNRFSTVVMSAVSMAATKVADKLKAIAAAQLDVAPDDIVLKDGYATAPLRSNRSVAIRRLASQAHWDTGSLPEGISASVSEMAVLTQPGKVPDERDRLRASLTYSFQCDVVALEVDERTGSVAIEKYISVHDAGNLLNPKLADGQIWGGFAHGLGAAMSERIVYASDGTLLTSTLADYMCPTAPEIPHFEIHHQCTPSPFTVHGSKGLGDGCSMLTPAVIANALEDALGVSELVPPFTAPRVWELCNPDAAKNAIQTPTKASKGGLQLDGKGTVLIRAKRELIWDTLFSPESMKTLLPGCRQLIETQPGVFDVTLDLRVAGIGGTYDGHVHITNAKPHESATLSAEVQGLLGFGSGTSEIQLNQVDGGTKLSYSYESTLGGRVAGVGNRVLGAVLRIMIDEFFVSLDDRLNPSKRHSKLLRILSRIYRRASSLAGRE